MKNRVEAEGITTIFPLRRQVTVISGLTIDKWDIRHPFCIHLDLTQVGEVVVENISVFVDHFAPGSILRGLFPLSRGNQVGNK